jgi:hypothetical protein
MTNLVVAELVSVGLEIFVFCVQLVFILTLSMSGALNEITNLRFLLILVLTYGLDVPDSVVG